MFKIARIWAFGLFMTATLAAFANPAAAAYESCGMTVSQSWGYCEGQEWPGGHMITRADICQPDDDIILDIKLLKGCWNERGNITVTVAEFNGGNVVGRLSRPRYVRFTPGEDTKEVKIRIKDVFLWTQDPDEVFQILEIQITPVSAEYAAIVDDGLVYIGWQPSYFGPSDGYGKGLLAD